MRAALPLALALLAGCGDIPQARSKAEIRSIAEDVADATAASHSRALEERIGELESRIKILEAENRLQKAQIDLLKANDDSDSESVRRLFGNDRIFADRLGIPMEKP